jgi:hypothetical protein
MNIRWKLLHSLRNYRNISGDLLYAAVHQIFRLSAAPVTIILVPLFLSRETQGYWFTMISMGALVVFADMGFSSIILQFSAHEFAHLRFGPGRTIEGSEEHHRRLASFFVFSLRWMTCAMLLVAPFILIAGFAVLSRHGWGGGWALPWTIYTAASALTLLTSNVFYFFEGCDSVSFVQKQRLKVSLIHSSTTWVFLALGMRLYALALSSLISSLFACALIYLKFRPNIVHFLRIHREHAGSWKDAFLPLILRYSISFISGYFIFQFLTPLCFGIYGPAAAGQIGISIGLWNGVVTTSNLWIYAITPRINILVSRRDWKELDRIFNKNLWYSLLTYALLAVPIFLIFCAGRGRLRIFDRFVSLRSMAILAIGWFALAAIYALAAYMRAHKQEPLMVPSVISAAYIVFSTWLISRHLSFDWYFLGILTSNLAGVPIAYHLFRKTKERFHAPAVQA